MDLVSWIHFRLPYLLPGLWFSASPPVCPFSLHLKTGTGWMAVSGWLPAGPAQACEGGCAERVEDSGCMWNPVLQGGRPVRRDLVLLGEILGCQIWRYRREQIPKVGSTNSYVFDPDFDFPTSCFAAGLPLPSAPSALLGSFCRIFQPLRCTSNRSEEVRVLSSLECPVQGFIFHSIGFPSLNLWKLLSNCKFYTHVQLGLKRWVGTRAPSPSSSPPGFEKVLGSLLRMWVQEAFLRSR